MTTKKTSQAQHETNTPAALPAFPAFPGVEMWRSMLDGQTERFERMLTEMERFERERHERSITALDDMTSLVKSSIAYQQELTAEWRKLGVEAITKSIGAAKA